MHTQTALALREKFLSGALSAQEIVHHFLQRITRYDQDIGAFLHVFEERALRQAEKLDAKRAAGQPFGKMAAIPVAIKDNIHLAGELTTCASKILSNYRPPFSATVVEALEKEDAILLGKTNLDEFAMGSSTEHSAFQLTRNPWDLRCTPGGSSGGSAAAVASRFCPIAFGSDTGGSIRQPASFCGVVGYKPTYGRVSRFGLVAFGSSLDQIGPFATNTADAALAMEVIGRHCNKDSTSIQQPPDSIVNTLNGKIEGLKVGVPWDFLEGLSDESMKAFKGALATLESLGATISNVSLDTLRYSMATYYILATAEASTNLARFDGVRYGPRSEQAKNLDEVFTKSRDEGFGEEVKRRILLGTFVLSAGFQDAYYKKAQKVRTLLIQEFAQAFTQCDIVAMPTTPTAAFELGAIHDPIEMYLCDIFSICANLGGLPAISVPSGYSSTHKPLGLQLLGPQLQDAFVLKVADAFEKARESSFPLPESVRE